MWLLSVHENAASRSMPSTNGTIRLVTPGVAKIDTSRPPRITRSVFGVPPVSFLPRHATRRYSRTILVSQLSAVEPLTVTSFFSLFHSASEGIGERPGAVGGL